MLSEAVVAPHDEVYRMAALCDVCIRVDMLQHTVCSK